MGVESGKAMLRNYDLPVLSLAASTLLALFLPIVLLMIRPQLLGTQSTTMVLRFFPRLAFVLGKGESEMQQASRIDSASKTRF
jgi:hypothetical protein